MQKHTVCVIGGGVVGASVALALARRDGEVILLEAERELALGASGTNSGILHTGFDSPPGTLETKLILRAAELREQVLSELRVPFLRVGAVLRPRHERERAVIAELAAGAHSNGVEVALRDDGGLEVPGEWVTDPVAFALSLAAAAQRSGAEVACGTRVEEVRAERDGLVLAAAGDAIARCQAAVNCAGLHADEVARAAGDDRFRIYPRKGEFLVFESSASEPPRILLPVPQAGTKGVILFPTVGGEFVAGPTAHDQDDKRDWSVRPQARAELIEKASELAPEIRTLEPIGAYAGLRPAGVGVNYLIEPSHTCPRLVHAAAIRSTGLSAALAIAERVTDLLAGMGVPVGPEGPLVPGEPQLPSGPWWQRSARYWAGS
jgi:glycerol-3-phosphate dehydrogenase